MHVLMRITIITRAEHICACSLPGFVRARRLGGVYTFNYAIYGHKENATRSRHGSPGRNRLLQTAPNIYGNIHDAGLYTACTQDGFLCVCVSVLVSGSGTRLSPRSSRADGGRRMMYAQRANLRHRAHRQ